MWKKRNKAAATAAQARQESALRAAGFGVDSKEHERNISASTASRNTGFVSPPLPSPIFGIPPPPPTASAVKEWDGRMHERNESNSTSTTATFDRSLASPKLGVTFDFEFPPSPALSSDNKFGTDAFFRPSTSDGSHLGFGEESGRKSSVTAPVLPHIPRDSDWKAEPEPEELKTTSPVFGTFSRRAEEHLDREAERQRLSTVPPPPAPVVQKPRTAERPISPPSYPPPRLPQLLRDKESEKALPSSQPPPRQSSFTPSKEEPDFFPAHAPAKPRIPPPQIPAQQQIPIPPPPSIPPPQIPVSKERGRDQSDNVSTTSQKSKRSRIKSFFFDKPSPDFLSESRSSTAGGTRKMSSSSLQARPSTSSSSTTKMEPSLFPSREEPAPALPRQESVPVMNRAWLDARDKPYQNATPKAGQSRGPYMQQTHSTPDLLAASTTSPLASNSARSPYPPLSISTNRSPLSTSASADPSPQSPRLTFVRPASSFGKSPLSAESEVSSPGPTLPTPTVGTPYQETSPTFPLPQHVATRPKTAGAGTSSIGGVSVPTHYSSSKAATRPETSSGGKSDKGDDNTDKKERRKTRLLNPLNLISRRRSGQDEEVVQNERAVQVAQAQALQKQKTVAIAGVNKIPENYDPRIRGKVVHDFSAPRGSRRTGSYSDGPEPAWNAVARGLQSAHSAPYVPALQDDGRQSQASGSGKHLSVSTMGTSSSGAAERKSRYVSGMGVFHEHLSETPDRGSRISSLQAEKRENKDFLQRASHLSQQSQESAILPPFARRSQPMDPVQASHFNDSNDASRASEQSTQVPSISRTWNGNRDSGVSSVSGVSPITARTSSAVALSEAHISFSPVSPTSPGASKPASDGRSPGAISPPVSEGRPPSSYFSAGLGSKSSRNAASPLDERPKSVSPAPSPNEAVKEATTPKKEKKKGFSIKIPLPSRAPEVLPRGPSAASGYAGSPISSPTSRSVKSAKSARSIKSAKSGRSIAGTPSLHSLPSNVPTPEPQIAEPAIFVSAPKSPRFVEKLATAVGHGKRNGNKKEKLEHQMSNASRFSFQFGGSAAEELALEEKARKMRANGEPVSNPLGDEDEDDFFDEDAMDDMDEMEMQAEGQSSAVDPDGIVVNHVGGKPLTLLEQVQLFQAQQAQQAQEEIQSQTASVVGAAEDSSRSRRVSQFMYRTATATAAAKAKLQLQLDIQENDSGKSESEDDHESDDESGYWAHDDFMDYSANHTREPSVAEPPTNTGTGSSPPNGVPSSPSLGVAGGSAGNSPKQPRLRQRGASAASAHGLTLNTNVGPSAAVAPALERPSSNVQAAAAAFVQSTLAQQARSGFYMQPAAAGYSPTAAVTRPGDIRLERPAVPHRDSGNSERNRAASGLAFASDNSIAGHKAALSSSTNGSGMDVGEDGRPFSQSTVGGSSSSEPRTTSTGLGLSGFSDFKFTDSAPPSRPLSLEQIQQLQNRRSRDSETIPRDVNWTDSNKGSPGMRQRGRNSSALTGEVNGVSHNGVASSSMKPGTATAKQALLSMADDDDVYFDDGRFDLDIEEAQNVRGSVNESAFDDDRFDFDRINGVGQAVQPPGPGAAASGHSRDVSGLTITSLGSDGPYPSFAMPNAAKARQRDSSYLLEDLPLQEQAVDPRFIPRRNPSEDAKRLGLSDKVPPLPPQPGSLEAVQRVSASLQAYHAALADAANKAAADGRFSRMPSDSTARSESAFSNRENGNEENSQMISRDASHYSRNEDGKIHSRANGVADLDRTESVETSHSKMGHSTNYSPPKPDFDFGFDSIPNDDAFVGDLDDLENEDDIVAAANAEALASDDEGFYGQEFGFYAKARPNSGDLQALIGGYFGEDGDDGLTRNKSIKEPNLTPITERSEFSTRNSFIGLGGFGPSSAGPMSAGSFSSISPAVARLPFSSLPDGEVTSFDQLRKLRAHAFSGSNGSLHSNGRNSNSSLPLDMTSDSPTWSTRSSAAAQGYFGPLGGAPMTLGYSTDSSASSNPSSAHPQQQLGVSHVFQDSPHSAASSGHLPFSISTENEATPKRSVRESTEAPLTARKITGPSSIGMGKGAGHSRKSSKDSVTYVQEQDPAGNGQPIWVLERRRTSEQGQLELVAREKVKGGWI